MEFLNNDVITKTKSAIIALSNPLETRAANEWLVKFEKSGDAWNVSVDLLKEESSEFKFFGAKFLYSKVQRQFFELDANQKQNLLNLLIHTLLDFSSKLVELNVIKYLCLSLSVLAIQMKQQNIVGSILQWLNPIAISKPKVLFILLEILPEEALNKFNIISDQTRNSFLAELNESSGQVINYLGNFWKENDKNNHLQIIKCLINWFDITKNAALLFIKTDCYFDLLNRLEIVESELFDQYVDLLISIIKKIYKVEPSIMLGLISKSISLKSRWIKIRDLVLIDDSFIDDDLEIECYSLCRLFSELSECCLELYLQTNSNLGQFEILNMLIEFIRIKSHQEICRIPLNFIYDLSMALRSEINNYNLLNLYHPIYRELLFVAVNQIELPRSVNLNVIDSVEKYNESRLIWKDIIQDCVDILGSESCLIILSEIMENEIKKSNNLLEFNWYILESVLFSMKYVLVSIPRDSSSIIPQLINFILTLPESLKRVQLTTLELLGTLSEWFSFNHMYLNVIYSRLEHFLVDNDLSFSSSHSLLQILKVADVNTFPVSELSNKILTLRVNNLTDFSSELNLLEAYTTVVSRLSQSQEFISIILSPIIDHLNSILQNGSDEKSLNMDIDRITVVFRSIKDPNFISNKFVSFLPLFSQILRFPHSESTCEKICRFYKFAIRNGKSSLSHLISSLANHFSEKFAFYKFPAFIYISSILISTFSDVKDSETISSLHSLVINISQTFFSINTSIQSFEQNPDLVEEYFYFLAKIAQFYPDSLIFLATQSDSIFQAGISGLAIRHREAQKGILSFFEKFIKLHEKIILIKSGEFIQSIGKSLIDALFQLLCGNLPAYALDENNGSISDVLWELKKYYPRYFQVKSLIIFLKYLTYFNIIKFLGMDFDYY